jgi:hypothetical protein
MLYQENLIKVGSRPLQRSGMVLVKTFFLNFIVKIEVNQIIPSQGRFGVLNGGLVRIVLLMFIV